MGAFLCAALSRVCSSVGLTSLQLLTKRAAPSVFRARFGQSSHERYVSALQACVYVLQELKEQQELKRSLAREIDTAPAAAKRFLKEQRQGLAVEWQTVENTGISFNKIDF